MYNCKMIPAIISYIVLCLLALTLIAFAAEYFGAEKERQPALVVEKGVVILIEFPDVQHNIRRAVVRERFAKGLNNYVMEMSYQCTCLDIDVTEKWYKMPATIDEYKISPRNLEVDQSRIIKLIEDAINAADRDVDFSRYSFAVIFMGAKVSDYGMVGLCGYPGMLGWKAKHLLKTKSGQVIQGGVAIFCYQAHTGTLFHDVAHVLGGVKDGKRMVPCLYDHDLQAQPGPARQAFVNSIVNMGFWDPMSCHFYEYNAPPPGISSWTKIRLNWIDAAKIKVVKRGEQTELILSPLEDGAAEILAVKIPVSETAYYLVENRQPIGYDKNLPGSGILIMHADDDIPECRHGQAPVKIINADSTVPQLKGAAFDIGKKDVFVDKKNKVKIRLVEKIGDSYKIDVNSLN